MCAEWEGDVGVERCLRYCVNCHKDGDLMTCAPDISSEPCRARTHAIVGCLDGNWSSSLWEVAGDQERVGPCFDVLADVKSGAVGLMVA